MNKTVEMVKKELGLAMQTLNNIQAQLYLRPDLEEGLGSVKRHISEAIARLESEAALLPSEQQKVAGVCSEEFNAGYQRGQEHALREAAILVQNQRTQDAQDLHEFRVAALQAMMQRDRYATAECAHYAESYAQAMLAKTKESNRENL